MASTDIGSLQLSGVFTGIDTQAIIDRILAVERIPVNHLQVEKNILKAKSNAVTAIRDSLNNLKSTITDLKTSAFFSTNKATSSNSDVATATADTTAVRSNYSIIIDSLASAAVLKSGTSMGPVAQKVARVIDPSATVNSNTSYGSSLTTGTFTVNGTKITITSSSTLNSVLTDIKAISGIDGTNTKYDASTDKITIAATSGTVTLGAADDTSNFLSRSHLYTNGTGSVTSLTTVGNIDTSKAIGSADSRIAAYSTLTSGSFAVNGASITVDTTTDTLQSVLDKITASSAGVYASYDSVEDRIVLTSKTTGNIGIAVADGTSNFASSMKLTGATSQLIAGSDTTFYVNDSGKTNPHKSSDNLLTAEESGITGLTITALQTNTTAITISIGRDTDTIKSAISDFVTQYNSVQSMITSYSKTPTEDTAVDDSSSILSGDMTTSSLANELRTTVMASVGTGTIRMLEDLGISANGDNNLLSFDNPSALDTALSLYPNEVVNLFTDATNGIMVNLENVIDAETDTTTGALTASLTGMDDETRRINDSIDRYNEQIADEEERLIRAFSAMEAYQATTSAILNYLTRQKSS
jgi:flagellar hook-associated protein 2